MVTREGSRAEVLMRADGDVHESSGSDDPPRPRPIWTEALTVPELLVTLPGAAVAALAAPPGGARPVLVLPGFVTGDITTAPLRAFLRSLGHRPFGWGLGLNVGVADHIAGGLDRLIQELAHRHGSTIDIVGLERRRAARPAAWHSTVASSIGQVITPRLTDQAAHRRLEHRHAARTRRHASSSRPHRGSTSTRSRSRRPPSGPHRTASCPGLSVSPDARTGRGVRPGPRLPHRAGDEPVRDVRDRRPSGTTARRLAALHPPPASAVVVPIPRTGALRCIS